MPDHVHLLVEGRPTLAMATVVHRLKGSTSHWLLERGAKAQGEALWQRGYGIFTVSESNRERPPIRQGFQSQAKPLATMKKIVPEGTTPPSRPLQGSFVS